MKKDRFTLSRKCFDYYNENHSIENSSKIFINYVENSRMKWKDIIDAKVLNSFQYEIWKRIKFLIK